MIEKSDYLEMHAIIRGQVQGVFFRSTAREIAHELHITGTVKNNPDGTVEIRAQGPSRRLHLLLERLQDRYNLPENSVSIMMSEPKEFFEDFRVIY